VGFSGWCGQRRLFLLEGAAIAADLTDHADAVRLG